MLKAYVMRPENKLFELALCQVGLVMLQEERLLVFCGETLSKTPL